LLPCILERSVHESVAVDDGMNFHMSNHREMSGLDWTTYLKMTERVNGDWSTAT